MSILRGSSGRCGRSFWRWVKIRTQGLRDTPGRVARMYAEMFRGMKADPAVHLRRVFPEKYDEIVLVKDISFESMCEHHFLPFFGVRSHRIFAARQGGGPLQDRPDGR